MPRPKQRKHPWSGRRDPLTLFFNMRLGAATRRATCGVQRFERRIAALRLQNATATVEAPMNDCELIAMKGRV